LNYRMHSGLMIGRLLVLIKVLRNLYLSDAVALC